jgi:hypothetical protein
MDEVVDAVWGTEFVPGLALGTGTLIPAMLSGPMRGILAQMWSFLIPLARFSPCPQTV